MRLQTWFMPKLVNRRVKAQTLPERPTSPGLQSGFIPWDLVALLATSRPHLFRTVTGCNENCKKRDRVGSSDCAVRACPSVGNPGPWSCRPASSGSPAMAPCDPPCSRATCPVTIPLPPSPSGLRRPTPLSSRPTAQKEAGAHFGNGVVFRCFQVDSSRGRRGPGADAGVPAKSAGGVGGGGVLCISVRLWGLGAHAFP